MQRRQLLLSAATVAGGLVVHFSLPGQALAQTGSKNLRKEALESWLALGADGRITVYSGKVDLGTGVKTALTQMVADELDVDFQTIQLVMGDTASTVDQGQTAGSLSISVGGQQLRRACATARQAIAAKAAARWGIAPEAVRFTGDGRVQSSANASQSETYAALLADGIRNIEVDPKAPLKKPANHRYVGKSVPRVDIPAKVTGEFTYIQDFELPGMLHARVLRPAAIGSQLMAFDDTPARKVKGYVATVRKGNFLAVVAKTEWAAIKAQAALKAQWSEWKGLPEKSQMYAVWRAQPVVKTEPRPSRGNVDGGFSQVVGGIAEPSEG